MDERPRFGLYVHWPFCLAKCPYCDFNSHVATKVDEKAWVSAYIQEIERVRSLTGSRVLDSVYFGGGTPSLMDPSSIDAILLAAGRAWHFSNDIEITLEANPTSTEAARFRGYRAAGVNRASVGLQALNDRDLRALGRTHSAMEGRAAFEVAADIFDRASFDIIYARQHQSLAAWETELSEALTFARDHISLYQLTVEPDTIFDRRLRAGGLLGLPDESLSLDMFNVTRLMTSDAGLPAYEVSNHARPGSESRHNLIYWESGDWAAIGPGAHGRLTIDGRRLAFEAHRSPGDWLSAVANGTGDKLVEVLAGDDAEQERMLMGLRTIDGVALELPNPYGAKISYINGLTPNKLLEESRGRLRLTEHGQPLLNSVVSELLS